MGLEFRAAVQVLAGFPPILFSVRELSLGLLWEDAHRETLTEARGPILHGFPDLVSALINYDIGS